MHQGKQRVDSYFFRESRVIETQVHARKTSPRTSCLLAGSDVRVRPRVPLSPQKNKKLTDAVYTEANPRTIWWGKRSLHLHVRRGHVGAARLALIQQHRMGTHTSALSGFPNTHLPL